MTADAPVAARPRDAAACGRCGAAVAVGRRAAAVTCDRCGADLRVKRSTSGVWTEPTGPPDRPPARPDRGARLAALDREWERERAALVVRGPGGREAEPSALRAALLAAVGLGGAAAALVMATGAGFPAVVRVGVPLLFAAVGVANAAGVLAKAVRWEAGRRRYEAGRAALADDGRPGDG